MKHYHILNGDALKERFTLADTSAIIIARECFIDGPVAGDSLEKLYRTRAVFLSEQYGGTIADYTTKVIREFEKIKNISSTSAIHLWFEDDVFCQLNFWFTITLIRKHFKLSNSLYLVRPTKHSFYGFNGLTDLELAEILKERTQLKDTMPFVKLWQAYQQQNITALANISEALKKEFPFIKDAVNAYIASLPTHDNEGDVVTCLKTIKQALKTDSFSIIFKEFCKRMPIYGYGDVQIKRILDTMSA